MTRSAKTTTKSSGSSKVRYRLGAYVRLSPTDEVREEGSLVSHPQRIRNFVDFKNSQEPGWGEIVEFYTDKDYSGGNTNRPAFKRLLQDLKYGHINAVIVTELSRISRDVKDFCNFWEFAKLHNATFISLKENFDTTTPIGEMMVIQAISFAQFERKTIVTRIKDGARARAERGLSVGGQRVMGYDLHPTKRGHLLVNEKEAATVRYIFDKFLELGSLAKTRDYLNDGGFRTKAYLTKADRAIGGNLWGCSSLLQLLTNHKFVGKVQVNTANRDVPDSEVAPHERYKIVEASWPSIISEEIFQRVQVQLEDNKFSTKHSKHLYRLAGLIECGICGKELSGQSANGKGGKYFYYAHSRKFIVTGSGSHKHRCPLERTEAVRIEEAAIARIIELARNRQLLQHIAEQTESNSEDLVKDLDHVIATQEQERRNLERLKDNLLATLAELPASVSRKTILDKIGEYEKQQNQLAESLTQLKEQRSGKRGKVIHMEQVFRLFKLFQKGFDRQAAHHQRDLLREIIQKVVVYENALRIFYYAGPNDDVSLAATAEEIEQRLLGTPEMTKPPTAMPPALSAGIMRSGVRLSYKMVGETRLELATSCSQSTRATNCATPRTHIFVTGKPITGRPIVVAGLHLLVKVVPSF